MFCKGIVAYYLSCVVCSDRCASRGLKTYPYKYTVGFCTSKRDMTIGFCRCSGVQQSSWLFVQCVPVSKTGSGSAKTFVFQNLFAWDAGIVRKVQEAWNCCVLKHQFHVCLKLREAYMHGHTHTHTNIRIKYRYTHMHIYSYTHIHKHTHTHKYTSAQVHVQYTRIQTHISHTIHIIHINTHYAHYTHYNFKIIHIILYTSYILYTLYTLYTMYTIYTLYTYANIHTHTYTDVH